MFYRILKIAFVFMAVGIVSGCAIGTKPDQAYVDQTRVGKVVMLETPPMTFTTALFLPLPIKNGMLPVSELKSDNKATDPLPVFKVDRQLAAEMAKQLSSAGRPTSIAKVEVPLQNLEDRTFKHDGQNWNWKQPIYDWYHSDKPVFNYGGMLTERDTFVMEVGIESVMVNVGSFDIILRSKLIDPKTGSIKGKTLLKEVWQDWSPRGLNPVALMPGEPLFEERLKELLQKAVYRNLVYFGFVKPVEE